MTGALLRHGPPHAVHGLLSHYFQGFFAGPAQVPANGNVAMHQKYLRVIRIYRGQLAMVTAAFTAMAMKTVLKKNATTPCPSTARRMTLVFTWTSETWQVMPMTKAK